MNILLMEDEGRIAHFVKRGLLAEGWMVDHAPDGETGLKLSTANRYDVVLLDLMLPGIQGRDVCRILRERAQNTPILMLTALDNPDEKVNGLKDGADDYLNKPFDFDELVARINALHRRATLYVADQYNGKTRSGSIVFHRDALEVQIDGTTVDLSKKERDLLLLFMSNTGRVLTRERILSTVWGVSEDPLTNVVDVYVGRLRRKLGPEGKRIKTLRSVGYRLS